MNDKQKRLKDRMDSEGGCTKVMTQAEWDRMMGGGKTRTGRTSTAGAKKTTSGPKKK